jgi:hypothetical protein
VDPSPPGGVDLDVVSPYAVDVEGARRLLEGVVDRSGVAGADLVLHVSDPLVRHVARRTGFEGALRAPLTRRGLLRAADEVPPLGVGDLDRLLEQVGAFLPGAQVTRRRGFTRGYDLRATGPDGARVDARVPRDSDLMAEPLAAALDTLLAVKLRFGRAASGIHALSFDYGSEGLVSGHIAGMAEGGAGVVVLTPTFVAVEQLLEQGRFRIAEGVAGRTAPARARPYALLDEVIAHECWHYLDADIRVSGVAYVELMAALGDALGVPSLEHALRGRERGAPPEWGEALARLVGSVSAYAATSPREATAEIFAHWWCGTPPYAPVVERFGEMVERNYPARA